MESGEFLDLTITSYSNQFGAEKINNSIYFGIQTPIDKYIHELEMIGSTTKDDKSEKRELRLRFLQNCVNDIKGVNNYLENFFKIMICWLNGGGNKPPLIDEFGNDYINYFEFNCEQYNKQKLIATVAGGNIIVIFAKLLNDLIVNITNITGLDLSSIKEIDTIEKTIDEKSDEIYNNLTTTNKNIINFMETDKRYEIKKNKFFLNLLIKLKNSSELYILISKISKSQYSDFDYSLTPNYYEPFLPKEKIPILINKLKALLHNDDKLYQGFGLFRIKSYVNCKEESKIKTGEENLKSACKKILLPNNQQIYERLFPQAVNQEDLKHSVLNNDNQDSINCKRYIQFLLEQKDIIKRSTIENINLVKDYFSEKLKNISEYTKIKRPDQLELEAIIFYINYNSFKINNYIRKWENGDDYNKFSRYTHINKTTKQKFKFENIRNLDYQSVLYSFLNLENIYTDNYSYLLRLVSGIFENFLNQDDTVFGINKSFSEELLDVFIAEKNKLSRNRCKIGPIKLTLVYNKKFKDTQLNYFLKEHVSNSLKKVIYSEKGFPDGFNIVLNTIVSDNLPEENDIDLDELEKDIVGDLIELLDISDSNKKVEDIYIDRSGKRQKVAGTRKKKAIIKIKKIKKNKKTKKIKKIKKIIKTKKR